MYDRRCVRNRAWIPLLPAIALSAACASTPAATKPAVHSAPPVVRRVPGTSRAEIVGGGYRFGAVRAKLVDVAAAGATQLEIRDATHAVTVELPVAASLDDAKSLVVVRLGATAFYGTMKVPDTVALASAARRDVAPGVVALLRAADDSSSEQVVAATDTLTKVGFEHVVLGLVPAGAPPPADGWESCPFPAAAEGVERGVATLRVDWDEEGRPGIVRVVEASGHGFGGAALLCALWQRRRSSDSCTLPCSFAVRVKFVR